MNWTGHTLAIVIVCLGLHISGIVPLSVWVVIPAIVTSTLIDADLKIPLMKHRGFTHTIIFIGLVAGFAYLVTKNTGIEMAIVTGIILGGLIHLGADAI